MVVFGGKKVGQVVTGLGGNGVGRVLVAVAAALLLRLFSGPGPALLPETEPEDREDNEEFDGDGDAGEASVPGKVLPVTIRWLNITYSLSDKSSTLVTPFYLFLLLLIFFMFVENRMVGEKNVANEPIVMRFDSSFS